MLSYTQNIKKKCHDRYRKRLQHLFDFYKFLIHRDTKKHIDKRILREIHCHTL